MGRQTAGGKGSRGDRLPWFSQYGPTSPGGDRNQSFTGRGAVQLRSSYPLERFAYSKPFFDPDGLIVAVDGEQRVGFVHAGFGPNGDQNGP